MIVNFTFCNMQDEATLYNVSDRDNLWRIINILLYRLEGRCLSTNVRTGEVLVLQMSKSHAIFVQHRD